MRDIVKYNNRRVFLFCLVTFILFVVSYSTNVFKITDDNYKGFDRADEGNVLGRMVLSREKGILHKGGVTGQYSNYKYPDSIKYSANPPLILSDPTVYPLSQLYDDYLNDRPIYDGSFGAYKIQPGGQAMMYSVLQEILPFSGKINLNIFRLITIGLTSLIFALFLGWIYRNYQFSVALIAFLFLLLSPVLFRFVFNLWWALWSFFIPFITMLLILERRERHNIPKFDFKLLMILFVCVFIKFFFTGGEFISSALVSATVPIIYYLLLETRMSAIAKWTYFFKSCIAALIGVLMGLLLLLIQLRDSFGNWGEAFHHIVFSYTKHNTGTPNMEVSKMTFGETLKFYFTTDMFYTPYFSSLRFSFGTFTIITLVLCFLLYFFQTRFTIANTKKYRSLVISSLISLIGPYSWYIFFPAHAAINTAFDSIVWYMPFLLFAFVVWGIFIKELFQFKKHR